MFIRILGDGAIGNKFDYLVDFNDFEFYGKLRRCDFLVTYLVFEFRSVRRDYYSLIVTYYGAETI